MRNLISVFIIGAVALSISSCGQNLGPAGPETPGTQVLGGLPAGAIVDSAYFMLHVTEAGGLTVVVHPQTGPWNESSVTWSDVGDVLSPFVITIFSGADTGWVKINVASLVSLWRDGIWANDGIIIDQNGPEFQKTSFHSREASGFEPKLMLYCSSDSCPVHVLTATADAYIRKDQPGMNFGADSVLATGWTAADPGEHRSLFQFDFTQTQAQFQIGSRVWNDANGNGIQDTGEEGIPEVGVILWDCAESVIAETHTNATGSYSFDSLTPGDYSVQFVAPEGYLFAVHDAGMDDGLDSDANPETGRTTCFTLSGNDDSWDAGLFRPEIQTAGCTHCRLYWKCKAGAIPQPAFLEQLFPQYLGHEGETNSIVVANAETAYQVLNQKTLGSYSNGITRLYAQLLATRLNIANGAANDAIVETVELADAFLTVHDWEDWAHLSEVDRKMVWSWKCTLARYNIGWIGPGSCPK